MKCFACREEMIPFGIWQKWPEGDKRFKLDGPVLQNSPKEEKCTMCEYPERREEK